MAFTYVASLMLHSGMMDAPQNFQYFGNTERAALSGVSIVNPYLNPADTTLRQVQETAAKTRAKAAARAKAKAEERRILAETRRRIALSSENRILKGLLDLPRLPETAPIDGCAKVNTGLTMGGGFMVFTCEKLRPSVAISRHEAVARTYAQTLGKMGWVQKGPKKGDETKFELTDQYGCVRKLSQRVWTDRSMNEPKTSNRNRDNYRQIVFILNYSGQLCQRYYQLVKSAAR